MVVNTCNKIPELILDVSTQKTIKLDKYVYWYEMGRFIVDYRIRRSDSGEWHSIMKEFVKDNEEKVIPEWVQDAPIEFIQNFIDGFVKSDGHNTGISFNLAFGIQRLYLKNRALSVSTPLMMTWGIADFVDEKGEPDGKFSMSLNFPSTEYSTPQLDLLLDKVKAFENQLLDDAVKNSESWFVNFTM